MKYPDTEADLPFPCPVGYEIRPRDPADDAHLVAAENAASRLFGEHCYPELADGGFPDIASFREMIGDGAVFVAVEAGGVPVGYAAAIPIDSWSHLRELAVHPAHGRKGLGRALVGAVVAAARKGGRTGVSLTTFRAVPFNRLFYEKLGFRELPPGEAPQMLAEAFRREVPAGIDPADRLLMLLKLKN